MDELSLQEAVCVSCANFFSIGTTFLTVYIHHFSKQSQETI